jgi:Ca2+-dependent lipid-binding protein
LRASTARRQDVNNNQITFKHHICENDEKNLCPFKIFIPANDLIFTISDNLSNSNKVNHIDEINKKTINDITNILSKNSNKYSDKDYKNKIRFSGKIALNIIKCNELRAADTGPFKSGKSDPYLKITLPNGVEMKSPTIKKELNPVFNYCC